MQKLVIWARQAVVGLLALWLLGAIVGLPYTAWAASGAGGNGSVATPLPWEVVSEPSMTGPSLVAVPIMASSDPGLKGTAETWTNPVFWIVLCLVVLGSLVVMADFPENR